MTAAEHEQEYYASLAMRLQAGDPCAFTELYDSTNQALRRYAGGFLREPDLVSDVLQEIYTALYLNISRLRPDKLMPYLRQIAYHVCCDFARGLRTDRQWQAGGSEELESWQSAQSEEDSLRSAYDQEVWERVRRALETCPARERQAFLLRYERGLKLAEVARAMDVSLATVKRYLQAVRRVLREELAPFLDE